jgi:uncharacterized protein involved in exopolysaccharide biosynthesis
MNSKNEAEAISIRDLIVMLTDWLLYYKTKLKWIVPISLISASAGLYIAYNSSPIYTAELTFAMESKGTSSTYSAITSQLGIDLGGGGGGAFSDNNIIELLKSKSLIEKSLLTSSLLDGREQLLINRYIESSGLRTYWKKKYPYLVDVNYSKEENRSDFDIRKDSILQAICKAIRKEDLSVTKTDKNSSIISVKFKSTDQLFARTFNEVLVESATNFYIQTKTQKSKNNLTILENRLDSVKRAMNVEIYGAAVTKDQNLGLIRAQGAIKQSQKQINVQILTTMYGELVKNIEIAKYSLMREEPLFQIIDAPILPLDREKLGKTKGTIIGGVLGVFLSLVFFAALRIKDKYLMNTEDKVISN